ncbi:hypothetical protein RhiirA1_478384, partial [Rhizophagus irregularis]
MSGNAKRGGRGGRQTRSSSIIPKPVESIWNTYRKKPQPTSDKKMTEAMEAERAMDMEKSIVQDTYGLNSKSSSGNDKGKATEKSKAYNKQLLVTPLGKQGAKVSFLDKEKFDQFLKMELIIQEQKEGDSGEPEKVVATNEKDSDTSQNSNSRTIQVIDIPAFRQVREIRESFEDLGEIEKIYMRGAGLYQVAFITYKDANSINYFNEQWSYHINKDIVR